MVFENRVLRRIFVPKTEEVAGEWRRLYNEELHNLYTSLNTIQVIKSRRIRWLGHVACMEKMNHIKYSSSSFQGLGLLACSGSEFIFLKLMNLLDSW
jgi:hypothetical protein